MTKSDPSLDNHEQSQYNSRSSSIDQDDPATINSSIKSENFKKIWKIIDENDEYLDRSFQNKKFRNNFSSKIEINGKKLSAKKDNFDINIINRNKSAPVGLRNQDYKKAKIRNYNIKKD
jgi:hypothetical protein